MKNVYDIIVIGGGPAGMMAAACASEKSGNKAKILLLEKNDELGKKLLITGGGRCNITNAEYDTRAFISKLGRKGACLHSTFAQFDVKDTFDFFEKLGLKIKVEEYKRAFPMDDKSSSVRNALMSMLRNVEIKIDAKVSGFIVKKKSISGVKMEDGEIIEAKYFILATGGTSHPETGSTGDAYKWLEDIGHKIVPPIPSLVPIAIKEQWVKDLQGLSLNNCKLTVFLDDKKKIVKKGRLLFTHFGISGPMAINLSGEISKLLKMGNVRIELDLMPKEDYATLKMKIKKLFEKNKNKLLKNCLLEILPERIVSTIIKLSKVDGEVPIHSVFREERAEIEKILKHMNMTVDHLLGPDKSIVTSGGVSCDEVDFKTMHSKLYPNLAFAGDILDIERPSGGYSLQICWSTGFVAGRNME